MAELDLPRTHYFCELESNAAGTIRDRFFEQANFGRWGVKIENEPNRASIGSTPMND